MDMLTRYQMRASTCLLTVALSAFTVKGWLLIAWVILGCPAADEYDQELRNGKVYAVHRRSGPTRPVDQHDPVAHQHPD
jgi:hypothetical protein